jgi:hypothetical protein
MNTQERRFVKAHRILNRAAQCPRLGSRALLGMLISAFAPRGPVILALNDTIKRRRGKRIAAGGISLGPVRSSEALVVKASGLRWVILMLLTPSLKPDGTGPGRFSRLLSLPSAPATVSRPSG